MIDQVFGRGVPRAVAGEVELPRRLHGVGHPVDHRPLEAQRDAVLSLLRHCEACFLLGGGDERVARAGPEKRAASDPAILQMSTACEHQVFVRPGLDEHQRSPFISSASLTVSIQAFCPENKN